MFSPNEKYLTFRQIERRYGFSYHKIRGVFKDMPGVICLPTSNPKPGARPYFSRRVPESLVIKTFEHYTNGAAA